MRVPCATAVTSSVGIDNQVTLGIIATCGPHGIYKTLGIAVDGLISRRSDTDIIVCRSTKRGKAPRVVRVEHLIVAFEEQVFVVILELLGNLLPHSFEAFLLLGIVVFAGHQPRSIGGTCIMMDVEDAIHALADNIVHHLMHAFHPCFLYLRADAVVGYVPYRTV